jgi:hypothetical protein
MKDPCIRFFFIMLQKGDESCVDFGWSLLCFSLDHAFKRLKKNLSP